MAKLTELQRLAVDALYNLGPMTESELATACLRDTQHHKGGFVNVVRSLFRLKLINGDDCEVWLTEEGCKHGTPCVQECEL
jgi:hypothetical protein